MVKIPKTQFALIFIDGIENRETTQAWINSILIKKLGPMALDALLYIKNEDQPLPLEDLVEKVFVVHAQ